MTSQDDRLAAMSARKRSIVERARDYLMPKRVEAWLDLGVPLVIGRREGYRIWDVDGRELLDLHLNGGTYNLGHRNPELVGVLRDALDELDVGNHHFPSEARADLAEALARATPGDLHFSVLVPSGSEANDLAIRVARRITGRRKIVALEAAFHGRTALAAAAGKPDDARFFVSDYPDEFATVPFDDLGAMERALAPGDVAAVLMETMPATYGFPVPSDGYLRGVKQLCERYGALYVADEVQTGLGRTGTTWYFQQEGVTPDLLVTGKGLSGGVYPIAATLMTAEVHRFFGEHPFCQVSTFGGADLGCVAAAEVVDLVTAPGFAERVNVVGERLEAAFADLPFGVRRRGMLLAFVFEEEHGGMTAMKALFDAGIYAFFASFDPRVLQFKPALVATDDDVDAIIAIVRATFG